MFFLQKYFPVINVHSKARLAHYFGHYANGALRKMIHGHYENFLVFRNIDSIFLIKKY